MDSAVTIRFCGGGKMTKPDFSIQPPPSDAIDLEVANQQELGRLPFCDSDSQFIDVSEHRQKLRGPHARPRCGTVERELLKNPFPAE